MEGSLRSAHAKTAQLQDLWQRSHLSGVVATSMQINLGNAVLFSQDRGLGHTEFGTEEPMGVW